MSGFYNSYDYNFALDARDPVTDENDISKSELGKLELWATGEEKWPYQIRLFLWQMFRDPIREAETSKRLFGT